MKVYMYKDSYLWVSTITHTKKHPRAKIKKSRKMSMFNKPRPLLLRYDLELIICFKHKGLTINI